MSDEQDIATEESPGGMEISVEPGELRDPAEVEIPDSLPVLPLKNTVLFPSLLSPLLVNSERSKALIDEVLLVYATRVLLRSRDQNTRAASLL